MKKLSLVIIFVCLGGIVLLGASCAEESGKGETVNIEQKLTEENQQVLLKNQPPVRLSWSLERENINRRTDLWNDSSKISYIYLVSYGKVMAFYTVKGKVSSVNSQVTNPTQILDSSSAYNLYNGNVVAIPSPAEDGSYGTNGDAIFFFTTEGVYVEWAGEYMLADQPLKLTTPPALYREVK